MTESAKRPLVGVAFMLGAMATLPFLDVLAKFLGQQGLPVLQIVWARLTLGAMMTLPFALRIGGRAALWPDQPVYHLFRAALLVLATFSFFLALKYLPIADALAIFFVQPLVATVLSALVLREVVGPRRWGAVAVGFVGTLIIIRPGFAEVSPGSLYALLAGVSLACYFVMTRRIAGRTDAMITTFHTSLLGGLILSLVIWTVWQWPTPQQWVMMIALAVVANFGHLLIVRAYDHAEASLLAPLAYTEMIMATVLGWVFFRDFPDGWTILGVSVLIACAVYISVRERALGRRQAVITPAA